MVELHNAIFYSFWTWSGTVVLATLLIPALAGVAAILRGGRK